MEAEKQKKQSAVCDEELMLVCYLWPAKKNPS